MKHKIIITNDNIGPKYKCSSCGEYPFDSGDAWLEDETYDYLQEYFSDTVEERNDECCNCGADLYYIVELKRMYYIRDIDGNNKIDITD